MAIVKQFPFHETHRLRRFAHQVHPDSKIILFELSVFPEAHITLLRKLLALLLGVLGCRGNSFTRGLPRDVSTSFHRTKCGAFLYSPPLAGNFRGVPRSRFWDFPTVGLDVIVSCLDSFGQSISRSSSKRSSGTMRNRKDNYRLGWVV